MEEKLIKTHLIITDIHSEYFVRWFGSIKNSNPLFKNGKPVFILISREHRRELNTTNMKELEECAKRMTNPKGRGAVSTDQTRIYIKEVDNKETYIGVVTHNRVKTYAPMYDRVGYR